MTDTSAEAHTAIVEDHPYESPPGRPWGLCRHCNLQEAAHTHTRRPYVPTSPPASPPDLPPNARPTGKGEPDPGDLPIGVTAEGMSSAEYTEHAEVKPTDETHCWRCGTTDGVRKLTMGAVLCPACEQILKP